jgi:hypothetical protein
LLGDFVGVDISFSDPEKMGLSRNFHSLLVIATIERENHVQIPGDTLNNP